VLFFSATRYFKRYGALSGGVRVQIIRPKFQNAHHVPGHTQDTLSAPHRIDRLFSPRGLSRPSQERRPLDRFERIALAPAMKVVLMKLLGQQALRVDLTSSLLITSVNTSIT
jgi:hypothetical protein